MHYGEDSAPFAGRHDKHQKHLQHRARRGLRIATMPHPSCAGIDHRSQSPKSSLHCSAHSWINDVELDSIFSIHHSAVPRGCRRTRNTGTCIQHISIRSGRLILCRLAASTMLDTAYGHAERSLLPANCCAPIVPDAGWAPNEACRMARS